MKRQRLSNLLVSITNANGNLKRLGSLEGELDDGNTDAIDYVIHFRPPIERSRGCQVFVSFQYQGNSRVFTRELFGRFVWPKNQKSQRVVLRSNELEYEVFETHQLRIEKTVENNEVICAMYVRLINATTSVDPRYDLLLCADVSVSIPEIEPLSWFPPDVDPAQWGLSIDSRMIPQRTALWFALRGELSGSRAYKLLGYFADAPLSGSNHRMRLGTYSEEEACIVYKDAFPRRQLKEVGWCGASKPYPKQWGASPDMLLIDKDAERETQYPQYDYWQGVLEIKTSSTKTSMEDYFYPQLYMEMIATQSVFADVIRYCPNNVAHVYRVKRDMAIEQMLISLWKRALNGASHQEQDFVQARALFSKMASDATWECDIRISCTEKITAYRARLAELRVALPSPSEQWVPDVDGELYEKSLEVAHAIKNKRPKTEVMHLIADQMKLATFLCSLQRRTRYLGLPPTAYP